jgi:hypothetical protein
MVSKFFKWMIFLILISFGFAGLAKNNPIDKIDYNQIKTQLPQTKENFEFSETDTKKYKFLNYSRIQVKDYGKINKITRTIPVYECGANKIASSKNFITSRHCLGDRSGSGDNGEFDAPINLKTEKAVELPKPKLGLAYINVFHFKKKQKIKAFIFGTDKCRAFFSTIPDNNGKYPYIQEGDSGGGVIQFDSKNNPVLVGTINTSITVNKSKPLIFENNKKASTLGTLVYRDCKI